MSRIAGLSYLVYKNGGSLPKPTQKVVQAAKKAVDSITITGGPSSPQKGSGIFSKIVNCAKKLYNSMADTAWMNGKMPAKSAFELRQGQLCMQLQDKTLPKAKKAAIVQELCNITKALKSN